MTMNGDFANGELSIEELEAIAAGWPHWLHSAVNAVGHAIGTANSWVGSEVRSIGKNPVVASMAGTIVVIGAIAAL